MEYEKKRKLKLWFKARWKFLVGTGAFLLTGLIVMLIGFSVSGWSIIAWLQSRWCVMTIICVVLGASVFGMMFVAKKNADLTK